MKKNLFKKAFSLIELLLGLSIIAALTITVFIAYNSYQVANQARVISGDISNIRASVAELCELPRHKETWLQFLTPLAK
jgi:prepilin-type N-terminal cleavage/methylation domain-containing protein